MYEFLEETVGAAMTTPCKHVAPELTVGDLHRLFDADHVEAFPVVRNGHVIGIVSKFDALRPFAFGTAEIVPHYDDVMGTVVEEIMSHNVISVTADARLTRVLQTMVQHKIKSVPVLDHEKRLVGIVAREDVFRALRRCTKGEQASQRAARVVACQHID
ncbi:CBS domain-containing protein [Tardiphaga sp. P9-11]|jgi:CBS domain-containing protein|uniref:CBS domain-containing protein n=1 Tax=Tardiphaga sp. P9-11 TaxID=2024614 RepID=UPI0011F1352E|nr:CBS domain-containing protein [Tardiphaga sp. P9-11]KAA0074152.1 CBS domain-containing protein [Tardiphaga sp. P9-11]